MPLVEGFRS